MDFHFTNTQLTVAVAALFLVVAIVSGFIFNAARPGLSVSVIVLDGSTTAPSRPMAIRRRRRRGWPTGKPAWNL